MSKAETLKWNNRISLRKWDIKKMKQAEHLTLVITACICVLIILVSVLISTLMGGVR